MIISIYPFDKQLQEHLGILVQCDASGLSIKIDNSLSFLWKITALVWSLLIAKLRLKLKKEGTTTRPFRYDLNQIRYDYTVEVRNRFKGLDLIDRVPMNYGRRFMTLYRRQGSRPCPRKKCKKTKRLSEEALQTAVKRREVKSKGEKERYTHLNAEIQRIARRDKKALLSNQCKEIEENNRMGKTRDLFKKIRDTKGTFMQRWAR